MSRWVIAAMLLLPALPAPAHSQWVTAPDVTIELVASGFRLPVNIAFVPNPRPEPDAPIFYVTELYGSIQVMRRDGVVSTYASGLLDYNPTGPISGSGEQGLTGLAVHPTTGDLYITHLWDNGSPPGGAVHYPVVERLTSTSGGLTMSSRTVLRNMQPETQGQSHQISTITIGPDGLLYVHMGDGFNASTALNLNQYRGKILRMNLNGTPVTTNPFYNAANGISAQDYIYAYGFRNPFGGAWRYSDSTLYFVEPGNGISRMGRLFAGISYGWNGSDASLISTSLYVWNPDVAPVNIAFLQQQAFTGSGFPSEYMGRAYVTQSGPTAAVGPGTDRYKCVTEFGIQSGGIVSGPRVIARYNGTGRSSVAALAAGPDGLYFSDLYAEFGASPTEIGANIYRLRYRPACPADVSRDGIVDLVDLATLLTHFGAANNAQPEQGDVNSDRAIDLTDLAVLLSHYGSACP